MRPLPIVLGACGLIGVCVGAATWNNTRRVALPVYEEKVTFFQEGKQAVILASLPSGIESMRAESCRNCHKQEYREWKASAHSRSVTEPVFQTAFKAEPRFLCRSCHSPLLEQQPKLIHTITGEPRVTLTGRPFAMQGQHPFLSEPNPKFDQKLVAEGVTCVTCHVREGSILSSKPTGRATAPHPLSYAPQMAKAEYCAGCHQFDIKNPGAHPFDGKPTPNPQIAKIALAVQHGHAVQQVSAPGDRPIRPAAPGKSESDPDDPPVPEQPGLDQQYQQEARVQHTLDEFHISPSAAKGETCQSCHMPHRDKGFAHTWPGRNELAMLKSAVTLSAKLDKTVYAPGEKLQAVIHLKNSAGHSFPTGDSLHAGVLDLWLCDGRKTLGRQVFLMSNQTSGFVTPITEDGRSVFIMPGSRAGTGSATLEGPTRSDTRLLPGEDAMLVFRQKVTEKLAAAKNPTLRVRLFHAGVSPALRGSTVDPKERTLKLMREETLPVRVERETRPKMAVRPA